MEARVSNEEAKGNGVGGLAFQNLIDRKIAERRANGV